MRSVCGRFLTKGDDESDHRLHQGLPVSGQLRETGCGPFTVVLRLEEGKEWSCRLGYPSYYGVERSVCSPSPLGFPVSDVLSHPLILLPRPLFLGNFDTYSFTTRMRTWLVHTSTRLNRVIPEIRDLIPHLVTGPKSARRPTTYPSHLVL